MKSRFGNSRIPGRPRRQHLTAEQIKVKIGAALNDHLAGYGLPADIKADFLRQFSEKLSRQGRLENPMTVTLRLDKIERGGKIEKYGHSITVSIQPNGAVQILRKEKP